MRDNVKAPRKPKARSKKPASYKALREIKNGTPGSNRLGSGSYGDSNPARRLPLHHVHRQGNALSHQQRRRQALRAAFGLTD